MKTPSLFLLIVLFVVGGHVFAQSDEDERTQQKVDRTEERIKKEAEVKEAEAIFNEKQKRFDEAAEELQEARQEYFKELSELSKPLLNELIDLSEEYSKRLSPFTSFAGQYLLDTESLQRQLEFMNEGVVGIYLQPEEDGGVLITRVTEDGPADLAGLQSGDVIVEVDDVDVLAVDTPYETTAAIINDKGSGSVVHFKIRRDDEHIDYEMETIDRMTLRALDAQTHQNLAMIGSNPIIYGPRAWQPQVYEYAIPERTDKAIFVMEIEEDFGQYFDVEYGVLVLKADDIEDLQPGDILLEIDERPVRSLSHALRHKRDADDEVEILFKRNKREKRITLDKDQFSLNAILQ